MFLIPDCIRVKISASNLGCDQCTPNRRSNFEKRIQRRSAGKKESENQEGKLRWFYLVWTQIEVSFESTAASNEMGIEKFLGRGVSGWCRDSSGIRPYRTFHVAWTYAPNEETE